MFYYSLFIFSTISIYYLYPYIKENCRRLNSFKNIAFNLTGNKNICSIFKDCITIILKLIWLTLLQKINNSVIKMDKNKYLVQFCIKGKWYKQILHAKSGPSSIIQIIDEDENDVTCEVEPFCNGLNAIDKNVDVKYLKYKTLTFNMDDGNSKIITKDDKLLQILS